MSAIAAPGPAWLIQQIPSIVIPPALVYYLLSLSSHGSIPLWARLLGGFSSLPALLVIRSIYSDISVRRQAWSLGALLPPTVKDHSKTGWFLVKRFLSESKEGYLGETFDQLVAKYGNVFHFKLMAEHRIFTIEPDHVKAILATQFEDFEKGPMTHSELYSLLGQGIFNSDGDIWKFHRSMSRPFFVKERIGHFDVFERHAEDAIQLAKQRIRAGYTVDFQDLVFRFTLDSATEFLFGQDVCSLSAGLPYPNNINSENAMRSHPADVFAHSFGQAQELASFRPRRGKNWPLAEFFRDKVGEHRGVIDAFVEPLIAEAIRKKKELGDVKKAAGAGGEKDGINEDVTLLDHLVNCTEDKEIVRDEVLNILIAGRDTTAATLTFMTYMLSEHPEVLKKLRQEILEKVGPTRRPTFEDIKEMKYLRAVINETLRLYPPVPFNSRTSRRATTLPNKTPGGQPWFVPAGVKVGYSVFLMHRRKDLWGPDALEFDPDRFIDQRMQKYLIKNPFIFVPFNAGPRICLGQQFAYNEASYFTIRFLQSFSDVLFEKTSVPPPSEWAGLPGPRGRDRIWLKSHLTMYARGGVWMNLKEADENEGEIL